MSGRRIGDVEIGPEEIHIQLFGGAPAESFKGLATGGRAEILAIAFLLIPANTFAALVVEEFIEDPFTFWKSLAQVADRLAVDPQGHLAVAVAHVVDLHHHLNAGPFALLHLQRFIAHEAVAPGLSARRAAAHLAPIGVKIPPPGLAERLDAGPETLVARRGKAGLHHRPARRRIVAADAGAKVMDGCAVGIEFDIETRIALLHPLRKAAIKMPAIALPADVHHEEGLFARAALGDVGSEGE